MNALDKNPTIVEKDFLEKKDLVEGIKIKPYDFLKDDIKRQRKFDKTSTILGVLIISSYLFIIIVSFLLNVFNYCQNCYPSFLKPFEMLVLVITGFFFGTRVVHQYIPLKK